MGRIEPNNRRAELDVLGEAHIDGAHLWCCQAHDGSPVIEHQKTGKRYIIGWDEIILAAIAAGINN